MAKKKTSRKQVKKVTTKNKDLVKKIDSIVDEIERTNNFKKIVDEEEKKENNTEDIIIVDYDDKDSDSEEAQVEVENSLDDQSNIDMEIIEDESLDNKDEELNFNKDDESKDDFIEDITDSKELDEKINDKEIDINATNSYDFSFDDERLTEIDSLDTSFLEGRINNKEQNTKKKSSKQKNKKKSVKKQSNVDSKNSMIGILILVVIVLVILIISIIIKPNTTNTEKTKNKENTNVIDNDKSSTIESKNKEKSIDDNYLIVGDKLTLEFSNDDYFDDTLVFYSGTDELTTEELLEDLKDQVYIYNPSKVFIHVGIYDIITDNDRYIIDNIKSIIKQIKKNRPYAQIYIESLYPVNSNDDNEVEELEDLNNNIIEAVNKEIKNICKKNDVTYIDTYKLLYDKTEESLKEEYTEDGFRLSDEGYKVVSNKLKQYLN